MRVLVFLVGALFLSSATLVIAAEMPATTKKEAAAPKKEAAAPAKPAKKKSAKAKKPAAAPSPAPEKDPSESAVASCKKHLESMMRDSVETNIGGSPDLKVQPNPDGNFEVSGWVTSKAKSGETKRADFTCRASRYGGGLWTTKTSLSYDR